MNKREITIRTVTLDVFERQYTYDGQEKIICSDLNSGEILFELHLLKQHAERLIEDLYYGGYDGG
jgi:hypothetical protein